MGCERTRERPILSGQGCIQVGHCLSAAEQPHRAVTGRALRQLALGHAQLRRTALIGRHKIGLPTGSRDLVGEPIAPGALGAGRTLRRIGTAHDQHARTGMNLRRHLPPQGF